MSLVKYIVKRFLSIIPILVGILLMTFILSRMMPGDPVLAYLPRNFTLEMYEGARAQLGLDQPILVQLMVFLQDIVSGDWGVSVYIDKGLPVWDLIMERFPRTLDIAILSMIVAAIVGVKTGITSATHRNKPRDTLLRGFALLGVAIPVFFLGIVLQYTFGYLIPIFPGVGYHSAEIDYPHITGFHILDSILTFRPDVMIDYLYHLILPVFCLSFITLASITRQTRSSMLEVLEQDYIRTARAKGCKEKKVINSHALKNAMIPTITVIGLNFGALLGGAVLTEYTFNLNGVGQLMYECIRYRDYWVLNGVVFLTAFIYVTVNIVIDVLYAIIDPRIRY